MKLRVRKDASVKAVIVLLGMALIAVLIYKLSPDVRIGSVSILAWVGSDEALCDLMDDDDKEVRAAAVNALVLRGERATPALIARLDRPEAKERAASVLILGRIGPAARSAIPALKRRLREDSDPEIRSRAAVTLGSVAPGDATVIDELIEMLQSEKSADRGGAAFACRMLGADAKRAIPHLIEATRDANSEVREGAAIALVAIANTLGESDADLRERGLAAANRAIGDREEPQEKKRTP